MQNYNADQQTNNWLTANGISQKSFATTDIDQLKAQIQAHDLLTNLKHLLTDHQSATLTNYLAATNSSKSEKHITRRSIYAVMNISKQINRKLFKRNRKDIQTTSRR